jgi:hypothetical protein
MLKMWSGTRRTAGRLPSPSAVASQIGRAGMFSRTRTLCSPGWSSPQPSPIATIPRPAAESAAVQEGPLHPRQGFRKGPRLPPQSDRRRQGQGGCGPCVSASAGCRGTAVHGDWQAVRQDRLERRRIATSSDAVTPGWRKSRFSEWLSSARRRLWASLRSSVTW